MEMKEGVENIDVLVQESSEIPGMSIKRGGTSARDEACNLRLDREMMSSRVVLGLSRKNATTKCQ